MTRLPTPGSDDNVWGGILNDFLLVEHNADGTLKASGTLSTKADASRQIVSGTGLSGGGNLSADRTLSVNYGTTAGTAAQGNDSRITGAVQASTVTTKGDLLAATGNAAISRVGVGADGQVLTADSTASQGVSWSDGSAANAFPLSGYGLVAASDNPAIFNGTGSISTGYVWLTRVWVPPHTSFSKIAMAIGASGTYSSSSTPNRLGWYDDSGVLQDQTPDDSTMWSTNGVWYVGNLTATVPAQSTGRFIYIGNIVGGYTSVSHLYIVGDGKNVLAIPAAGTLKRRAMYVSGQATLPASFNPTTYGTITAYVPLVGLL